MVVVVRYTYTKVIIAKNDGGCRQVQWWLSSGTMVVVDSYNGGCIRYNGGCHQVQWWLSLETREVFVRYKYDGGCPSVHKEPVC